jgi:hypothetical protein
MQTKEAKQAAAIARNEHHRSKYEQQARDQGITSPEAVKEFADRKVGIPKKR